MVRRCIHKPTCQEYAVKIIDITGGGSFSSEEVQELREATLKEVDILRKVSGHPNISECWPQGAGCFSPAPPPHAGSQNRPECLPHPEALPALCPEA